jgi:Glycosyltransferases involved in cell wall biogenesis
MDERFDLKREARATLRHVFGYEGAAGEATGGRPDESIDALLFRALTDRDVDRRIDVMIRRGDDPLPAHVRYLVDALPVDRVTRDALGEARRHAGFLRGLLASRAIETFLAGFSADEMHLRRLLERVGRIRAAFGLGEDRGRSSRPGEGDEEDGPLHRSRDRKRVKAALSAVYNSSERYKLVYNLQEIREGEEASVEYRFYLYFNLMRHFLALNAGETAWRLGSAIAAEAGVLAAGAAVDVPRFRSVWAQACVRSGRVDQAVSILREAIERGEASHDVVFNLGLILSATDPAAARPVLLEALASGRLGRAPMVFISHMLGSWGDLAAAEGILHQIEAIHPDFSDARLLRANLAGMRGDEAARSEAIRAYFRAYGVSARHIGEQPGEALFGFSAAPVPASPHDHRVVVVMTTFNSAETVRGAIASVLAQSHENLELVVVDDVSTDDTRDILSDVASRENRVKLIFNTENCGTYVSKNKAIAASRCDFVTFHDSDDWMHPQRIEMHIEHFGADLVANQSRWVRMDVQRNVMVRRGGAYGHDNPAATFIRRAVFDQIGLFDGVRTGADTEFAARMRLAFGDRAVARLDLPLAVGLHHEKSLTQGGDSAFDEHRFSKLRLDYWEKWVWEHLRRRGGITLDPADI